MSSDVILTVNHRQSRSQFADNDTTNACLQVLEEEHASIRRERVVVVVVVGGSPLHFVLRTSLGLRNVNEVVEGVAYGRSLRVCNLEGSGGGC